MHRCVCESSVCTELIERLHVVMKAKMKEALDSLPPKMLVVKDAEAAPALPSDMAVWGAVHCAIDLATRVGHDFSFDVAR